MQDNEQRGDAEAEAPERRGAEGVIFDIARKAVAGSVRSILSSEDGVKALIGAIVPKEVGQTILREVATLRTETVRAVVAEFARFLERLDPAVEVQRVLNGLRFDIHLRVDISGRGDASPVTVAAAAPAQTPQDPGDKGHKAPCRRGRGRRPAS